MKKTLVYLSAVALIFATACNKELEGPAVPSGVKTVSVSLDAQTKTTLADEVAGARKVLWSEGDKIAINGVASNALTAGGTQSAEFSFNEAIADPTEAQPWNVLYPASIYKDAETVTLPAVQEIAEGDNIVPDVLPMAKQVKSGDVVLSHVAAILSIQVEGAVEVTELTLTSNAGEALSGDFTIDYATGALTAASGASDQVKVNILKNLAEGVAFVNVVVPAGTYADGFNVAVTGKDGKSYVKTLPGSKTVTAGEMFVMPAAFGVVAPAYFVTPAGAGDKSGANWENAMDIAKFNDAARYCKVPDGSVFYFVEGTFDGIWGDINTSFKAQGGYPAGLKGTLLAGRDVTAHETIFKNSKSLRLFNCDSEKVASFNGITFTSTTISDKGAALKIQPDKAGADISFKNCKFTSLKAANGGAIFMASGNVKVEDCVFESNSTTGYGGTICLDDKNYTKTFTAKNCTFKNNAGVNNGGVLCMAFRADAEATFEGCTFEGNTCAGANAGAVSVFDGKCTLKDCTFKGNSAKTGGAIHLQNSDSNLVAEGCTFTENNATSTGGAFAASAGQARLENCDFVSNKCSDYGGATVSTGAITLTVKGCKFEKNVAVTNGGVHCQSNGNAVTVFEDCTFDQNQVRDNAGAVSVYNGKCTISGSTFTGNKTTGSSGKGAAIQLQNTASNLTVSSSTFTGNTSGFMGGGIQIQAGSAIVDGCTFDSNTAVQHGGALQLETVNSYVKVNNSTFLRNKTIGTGDNVNKGNGSAFLMLTLGQAMINGCFVEGNGIDNDSGSNYGGLIKANGSSCLMISNTVFQDNLSNSHGEMQINSNTLFANVTLVGKYPSVRIPNEGGKNVWVNSVLLNIKGSNWKTQSVNGDQWANPKKAINVALKGGCIHNGYIHHNAETSTITKTATDVDNADYAALGVSKNGEGRYVIGTYPTGWVAADAATVESVLKNDFVIGEVNRGQQFYEWLHSINAL